MAHVNVQTQLSASESEAESESDESICGEEVENQNGNSKSGGLADVMAAILTKSVSKQSNVILAKGQTDREIRKRKRKRDKEAGKLKDDDSESDFENKQERIDKKKEWNNMNRVKPNPLEREKERRLQRIATRGVVQLFNAVRQQQKSLEEKMAEAGSSIKNSEKVLGSMTKGKFLDLLKGTIPAVSKDSEGKKKTKDQLATKDSTSDTKWKILRDDFMMGAKMKDWDKEGSDGEISSDDGGGDMDLSDSE